MEKNIQLQIKNIGSGDASFLQSMATTNPPLDVHTQYTYWVLCTLFAEGCFILFADEKPIGYITSIWNDKTFLIWQIAVLKEERGKGYSQLLINAVFDVAKSKGLNISVTISKDNEASYRAFNRYCVDHGIRMYENGQVDLKKGLEQEYDLSERVYNMELH